MLHSNNRENLFTFESDPLFYCTGEGHFNPCQSFFSPRRDKAGWRRIFCLSNGLHTTAAWASSWIESDSTHFTHCSLAAGMLFFMYTSALYMKAFHQHFLPAKSIAYRFSINTKLPKQGLFVIMIRQPFGHSYLTTFFLLISRFQWLWDEWGWFWWQLWRSFLRWRWLPNEA